MSGVERYLRRATRGLWGQKKRDTMTELRGAIEDKIYRYRLSGLSEREAEGAALRDLGSPTAIARDLNAVHTGPQVMRMALLLGVTGLLGMQAMAQMDGIRALPDDQWSVCTYDADYLKLLPQTSAQEAKQRLALPGEREKMIAECLKRTPTPGNQLLRLSDVWAALRADGVTVEQMPGGLYHLTFPGQSTDQVAPLTLSVRWVNGEKYVDIFTLVWRLSDSVNIPLSVSGTRNPVLSVGQARLHLGTDASPVAASDLYTAALTGTITAQLGEELAFQTSNLTDPNAYHVLETGAPDGTPYAVLDNRNFFCECMLGGMAPRYLLSVQTSAHGRMSTGVLDGEGADVPVVVATLPELRTATQAGRRAVFVERISGTDLRHLTLSPLPVARLRTVQP